MIFNKLIAFEAKWSTTKKVSIPSNLKENYSEVSFNIITPDNYLEYIT